MSPIDTLFQKVETATTQSLKKTLIMLCSVVFLLAFIGLYKIRYDQLLLVNSAKNAISDNNKINSLLGKKMILDQEKEALIKDYENLTEKNLMSIVEKAVQENKIELEGSFKESFKLVPIPFEEDFVEQQITIKTENLSLKNFINLIDSLRKESFVMFREIKIENKGKNPACQAILSMRKRK